jgi:DUF4097 and DUF4098 domain-containing protein YvlB
MTYTRLTVLALAALALPVAAAAQTAHDRERHAVRTVHTTVHEAVERYQGGGSRQEETERITRTLKIGANGELDLSNIAGDITVTRGRGTEAEIEIVKTARGRTVEDAKQMLGLVQVEINDRSGRAEVTTRYPSNENRRNERRNINVSVAYNVTAPAGTSLTVRSISGDVKVDAVTGDLSLESVSGNIGISNAGRISSAKSISGNVSIADTPIDGSAEASSVSGNVVLQRVKARRLGLNSVSGNLVVDDVTAERVDGQTVSGNVQFTSSLSPNGRYELQSHSGDVRVTLTGNTGFELEANSWSGSVRADIPGLRPTGDADRRGRRRTLRATHGNGSAILNITTFSGNAIVTRR